LNESNPRRPASLILILSIHLSYTTRLVFNSFKLPFKGRPCLLPSSLGQITLPADYTIRSGRKKGIKDESQTEREQERRCAETTGTGQDRMNVCFGLCSRTQDGKGIFSTTL
jgi:hypothetical protein